MRAVGLHLFPQPSGIQGADFRLGYPALSPEERIVIWRGLAPSALSPSRCVAPVALEGEESSGRVYAERVPQGVWLAEARPPEALAAFVVAEVLDGLLHLHAQGEVHGAVGPERVVLGVDGSVVLVGRGRVGGRPPLDVFAALSLFPTSGDITLGGADAPMLAAELRARSDPEDRQRLADWVHANRSARLVSEHTVVMVSEEGDAVDEVVPYLGPDRTDSRGILDRWAATTTTGGEVTDEVSQTSPGLAQTLWNLLSSPREHVPAADRFLGVAGQPSRALVSLLAEEPPGILPLPVSGPVEAFVLGAPMVEDLPTMVGDTPRRVALSSAPPRRRLPAAVQWLVAMAVGGLGVWVLLHLLR